MWAGLAYEPFIRALSVYEKQTQGQHACQVGLTFLVLMQLIPKTNLTFFSVRLADVFADNRRLIQSATPPGNLQATSTATGVLRLTSAMLRKNK